MVKNKNLNFITTIMNKVEVKSSKNHTMFNPGMIDDYGFTPEEFRVFARIMRRSYGSEAHCSESIGNMAKRLQISERLVRRAIRVLLVCGAITRTERTGETDILDFQTCDKWQPSEKLQEIRDAIDHDFKQSERERKSRKKSEQPLAETQPPTPCGNATTPLAETQPPPLAETQPKGTPLEGTPLKDIATPSKSTPLPRTGIPQPVPPFECEPNDDWLEEPDYRLRFFPVLEKSHYPTEKLNEIVELFAFIAEQNDRKTLIKETEWVEMCGKFFNEGMSVHGIQSLYRYCKEVCGQETITPKVMDWKFSDYKKFLKNKGVALSV